MMFRGYDPFNLIPFQSIGILRNPDGGYGTAQLLRDENGCKYLITSADNFIGKSYNFLNKQDEYTLELPDYFDF